MASVHPEVRTWNHVIRLCSLGIWWIWSHLHPACFIPHGQMNGFKSALNKQNGALWIQLGYMSICFSGCINYFSVHVAPVRISRAERVLDALSEWHSCLIRCWYEYCFVNLGFWVLVWFYLFCFSVFIIICPENECTIYSFNIMALIQKCNAWKCSFSIITHVVTQQQNNLKCFFFFLLCTYVSFMNSQLASVNMTWFLFPALFFSLFTAVFSSSV